MAHFRRRPLGGRLAILLTAAATRVERKRVLLGLMSPGQAQTLASGLGYTSPLWVGAAMAALALVAERLAARRRHPLARAAAGSRSLSVGLVS